MEYTIMDYEDSMNSFNAACDDFNLSCNTPLKTRRTVADILVISLCYFIFLPFSCYAFLFLSTILGE